MPATPTRTASFENASLSIVSHGQGPTIRPLLEQLGDVRPRPLEVIVTLNIPESEGFLAGLPDLPLRVIRNDSAAGFGANHNAAFGHSRGDAFVVINPDIRVRSPDLFPVLESLSAARVGACAPVVLSPMGSIEDSVRRFPTIVRLARRVVLRQREPDYQWGSHPIEVDWAAGMFIAFRREAFAEVGGFDEQRFFMYFEDADICRRLKTKGWSTVLDPRCSVVHDAQRASHRNLQHLRWHLTSALRYLIGF